MQVKRLVLCVCLGIAAPASVHAQSSVELGLELSTGVLSTTSALTGRPMTGALLRLGAVQQGDQRRVRARLDGELWLAPRHRSAGNGPGLGVVGVHYGVMVGPRRVGVTPYGLLAVGAIAGISEGNDYGLVGFTSRLGGGVRGRLGRRAVHAEFAVISPLLPLGRGPRQSLSWPITVGVVF